MRPVVWWLFGVDKGRWYCYGYYPSEQEARAQQAQCHFYDGEWDAYPLRTTSEPLAKQQCKALRAQKQRSGLAAASERIYHGKREETTIPII